MALRLRLDRPASRPRPDTSLAIINIVLLLIFFFLISGRLATVADLAVELPETVELPIEALPKPVLVWQGPDQMTLDGVPVAPADLAAALARLTRLHLLVDRNESAEVLLDLLRREEIAHLEILLVTVHRRKTP